MLPFSVLLNILCVVRYPAHTRHWRSEQLLLDVIDLLADQAPPPPQNVLCTMECFSSHSCRSVLCWCSTYYTQPRQKESQATCAEIRLQRALAAQGNLRQTVFSPMCDQRALSVASGRATPGIPSSIIDTSTWTSISGMATHIRGPLIGSAAPR